LDLTVFIQNKKTREATQKVLQAADAQFGGVDMSKLESVWQGLIKHQLLLIKDEVVKFTQKIPTSVRRVLRNEPRWREVIHFPGEDAAAIESRRTRRAMRVWRNKLLWVMFGDSSQTMKSRCCVWLWNLFVLASSWWLFNFDKFQLIQAVLVGVVLMVLSSFLRFIDPKDMWERVPSKQQLLHALPPQEKVEAQAFKAWSHFCFVSDWTFANLLFVREEVYQCYDIGVSEYSESAKRRFSEMAQQPRKGQLIDDEFEEEVSPATQTKKRSQGVANRIHKLIQERDGGGGGSGTSSTRTRGRRRPGRT